MRNRSPHPQNKNNMVLEAVLHMRRGAQVQRRSDNRGTHLALETAAALFTQKWLVTAETRDRLTTGGGGGEKLKKIFQICILDSS